MNLLEDLLGALSHVGERVDPVPERVAVAERPQHGAADILPYAELRKDVGHLEAAREAAPVDFVGFVAANSLSLLKFASPGWGQAAAVDVVEVVLSRAGWVPHGGGAAPLELQYQQPGRYARS